MSNKSGIPNYSFQMRGAAAIRIRYEGQPLGVFDLSGLWKEYQKTRSPNDPNKRYVIERAIERLQGKAPEYREKGSLASRPIAPRLLAISDFGPAKKSLLARFIAWVRKQAKPHPGRNGRSRF
jgi:hypothetical protein